MAPPISPTQPWRTIIWRGLEAARRQPQCHSFAQVRELLEEPQIDPADKLELDSVVCSAEGMALHNAGNYVSASPHLKRAADLCIEHARSGLADDQHRHLAAALNDLACNEIQLGNLDEAEKLLKRATYMIMRAYSPSSQLNSVLIGNSAVLASARGEHHVAYEMHATSLRGCHDTVRAGQLANYASALRRSGERESGAAHAVEAVEVAGGIADAPATLLTQLALSRIVCASVYAGDYKAQMLEAQDIAGRAVRNLADSAPSVRVPALLCLALLSDETEAVELLERALSVVEDDTALPGLHGRDSLRSATRANLDSLLAHGRPPVANLDCPLLESVDVVDQRQGRLGDRMRLWFAAPYTLANGILLEEFRRNASPI